MGFTELIFQIWQPFCTYFDKTTIDWFIALGEIRTKYYITTNSEFKIESSKIGFNVNKSLIFFKVEKQPQMINYWFKGKTKATKNLPNGWILIKHHIHVAISKYIDWKKVMLNSLLYQLNIVICVSSSTYWWYVTA